MESLSRLDYYRAHLLVGGGFLDASSTHVATNQRSAGSHCVPRIYASARQECTSFAKSLRSTLGTCYSSFSQRLFARPLPERLRFRSSFLVGVVIFTSSASFPPALCNVLFFRFQTVKATLAKKELQETFLEFDLLGVVKRWLQVTRHEGQHGPWNVLLCALDYPQFLHKNFVLRGMDIATSFPFIGTSCVWRLIVLSEICEGAGIFDHFR